MAKDYAKSARSKPKAAGKSGGALKPFIWGMVFGVALSAAAGYFLQDHYLAAKDLVARARASGDTGGENIATDNKSTNTATTESRNSADKKFKALDDNAGAQVGVDVQALLNGQNNDNDNVQETPATGKTLILACASFSTSGKADSLKAQIALSGLQADVMPIKSKDGASLYRVQLGPYSYRRNAEKDQHRLEAQGINTCRIW